MKLAYHPAYHAAPRPGDPFHASKFSLLRTQLLCEGIVGPADFMQPEPLEVGILGAAHTAEYIAKCESSELSTAEKRRLGIPWSDQLWLRAKMAAAGTLLAARTALCEGLAGNLAGGMHHAFADHGEGSCVLNDVAIAICQLRQERRIERASIIDLDVHQGNGTAAIFEQVDEVFTFSMYGGNNYPHQKMRSDLDVPLKDGIRDQEYIEVLDRHIPAALDAAAPELVFYLAGVNVAADDHYGKLALSDEGIRERERRVIAAARQRGLPLVIVPGGGYEFTRPRTAELHAHVFREAAAYERAGR